MKRRAPRWRDTLLILAPPGVLAAGVCLVSLLNGTGVPADLALRVALIAGAAAPLLAAAVVIAAAPAVDLTLFAAAAMLTAIGMSSLYGLSASPGQNQGFYESIATRHGYFLLAGFAAMILGVLLASRLETIARFRFTLLVGALGLTLLTAIVGETVNGARLWLHLGPFRFQPSEIARLLLIVFVAEYLFERRHLIASAWSVGPYDLPPAPYLVPVAGAVITAAAVLALQNDLGMAALVVLGAIAIVCAALQSRAAAAMALVLLAVAYAVAFLAVARVQDRVVAWLDPWADPMRQGFQFVTTDYSLAAGGFAGSGPTSAVARIPEVHTDFIFVGIAGQFGILAAGAVLALEGVVVVRSLAAAARAASGLEALLAASIATILGVQFLLVAGGTLRVLPLTGLTFPLVSYGGTSLLVTFFSIGIILGIGAKSTSRS